MTSPSALGSSADSTSNHLSNPSLPQSAINNQHVTLNHSVMLSVINQGVSNEVMELISQSFQLFRSSAEENRSTGKADHTTYTYSQQIPNPEKVSRSSNLAMAFFQRAKRLAEEAHNFLKLSQDQGNWKMPRIVERFNAAIQAYEEAKRRAQTQEQQSHIYVEISTLRTIQIKIALDMNIPLYLPDEKEQLTSNFLLLKDESVEIELIEELMQEQLEKYFTSSQWANSPSFCFFLAFTLEMMNKKQESGRWYLLLAECYAKKKSALFLIRTCLNKARSLDASLAVDDRFQLVDTHLHKKEKALQLEFEKCLEEISNKNPTIKPRCFIFMKGSPCVESWIENCLYPDLIKVGAIPTTAERDQPLHVPDHRFKAHETFHSDFIIPICTPELVLEDGNPLSPTAFDMDLLMKRFPGARSEQVIPFVLQGDWNASAPQYFTRKGGIDATNQEKYYFNSLRAFCLIKKVDQEPNEQGMTFFEGLYKRLAARKQEIEEDKVTLEQLLAENKTSSLPVRTSAVQPSQYAPPAAKPPLGVPEIRSTIKRKAWWGDFRQSNIAILIQHGDILFKTGKTTLASHYAKSSIGQYPHILWIDARNSQTLQASVKRHMEELNLANEGRDHAELQKRWNAWLENEPKWLLIFDHASDEGLVKSYFPDLILNSPDEFPKNMLRNVIITSRREAWTIGSCFYLSPFTEQEGVELIREITKKKPVDHAVCKQLVKDCAGIPQQIYHMATWIKDHPFPCSNLWQSWREIELKPKEIALYAKGNIPVSHPDCIGRFRELSILEDQLPLHSSLVIYGDKGVGKRQLALYYALTHAEKYDVIGWIGGKNEKSFSSSCEDLLQVWNAPLLASPLSSVEAFLKNKKWLLIIEKGSDEEQGKELLLSSPGGHMLLISSHPLRNCFGLEVTVFREEEGVRFVQERLRVERREAEVLSACVKNHPLGLALATAYMVKENKRVADYLELFRDKVDFHQATPGQFLPLLFEQSWNTLVRRNEPAASLLKICSLFDQGLIARQDLYRYGKIQGADSMKVDSWLNALAEYGMIDWGRKSVLVSAYICELTRDKIPNISALQTTLHKALSNPGG